MKRSRIKPVSDRRLVEQEEYSQKRIEFLSEHRRCEIGWETCRGESTDVHHRIARSQRSDLWLEVSNFVAACRPCHMLAENNPARAFEAGVSAHAWDAPESSKIVGRKL